MWIAGRQAARLRKLTERFDASESSSGNWTISFGDGTRDKSGTGTPPSALKHTFKSVGIYTTTLTVTDPVTGLSSVARAISTVSASRAPSAITKSPDVGATSAHLLADLWTNGKPTTYHFEWGTSPDTLTNVTADKKAHTGASSPAVLINGLSQGVRYYYRVVATNSIGTTVGETLSFSPSTGPKIANPKVKSLTSTSAKLSGTVNPASSATVAHFEWGVGSHDRPGLARGRARFRRSQGRDDVHDHRSASRHDLLVPARRDERRGADHIVDQDLHHPTRVTRARGVEAT